MEPMYEICLNHPGKRIKLAVMTVMEVSGNPTTHERDQVRRTLNTMIRDYVNNSNEQDRICLVDLAKGIPYHSMTDQEERKQIWDDGIHLKPAGYDRIATLVFDTIKTKL
jgi:lysophospholipase L1-like esterase